VKLNNDVYFYLFFRLKDETAVCDLIAKLQSYLEGKATTEEMCRIYLKRIETENELHFSHFTCPVFVYVVFFKHMK
jgi:hypothetical protein